MPPNIAVPEPISKSRPLWESSSPRSFAPRFFFTFTRAAGNRRHWPRLSTSTYRPGRISGRRRTWPKACTRAMSPSASSHTSAVLVQHEPPLYFRTDKELRLVVNAPEEVREVRLHYRHLNQAENYVRTPM